MLYLIDEPMADIGLRTAADDPDARVVLIQDGVFLSPDLDAEVYAVEKDVDVRGVDLPDEVERISYDALVDLIVEQEVKNFV
ncbi:DsrH/TusB family sulfur metabolism protein [Halostella sp. PRR32]|uniref:DsrH/TusB family sulfur metabolism protein n=1 Tax=Halostella sp. PRR32 TaxID=3098147 RepID=UPI002B1D366F|nr:DsrH/TusB family sulfur metabolism protein [Halostella sp. PRR32]